MFEGLLSIDDHTRQTTDIPGFKPFTKQRSLKDDHTRQTTDTPGFKSFTIQQSLKDFSWRRSH